jgi:ABC-type nitrate/sulfonate/bicarbonate transport system substrate-binding protein
MKSIRITGVPEHFNYPILQFIQDQPLKEDNFILEWIPEPKGSGAMNQSLRKGETEIAIILTESFVKDRIEGNPGRIIGYHIKSPLIWGIHANPNLALKNISDLNIEELKVLISRFGSGSHLMSFLLAKQEGWELTDSSFKVINDLEGAKKEIVNENYGIFLWEKFTTKPFVDQGFFNRIGEILTPWPCFVMVAHEHFIAEHPNLVKKIRNGIYKKSSMLKESYNLNLTLSNIFNISVEDINHWLNHTVWATDEKMDKNELIKTIEILKNLQLINIDIELTELVEQNIISW